MLPLHQLRIKLANALKANDSDKIKETVDEIFDSMGGCEICYGRGYHISHNTGKLCSCERAKRLEEFIKNYA